MTVFKLPDLGEGLPDAEIHEWYIAEGDHIKIDQPLVAMETAKAVVDIPSPLTGTILRLYGKKGDIIKTDTPLMEFVAETTTEKDTGTVVGVIETSNTILTEIATGIERQASVSTAIKAPPLVRKLADMLQIDLSTIKGTGPGHSITTDDVKQAAANPSLTEKCTQSKSNEMLLAASAVTPLQGTRRAMAKAMAQSHSQVVPVTVLEDADLHELPPKVDLTLHIIQAIIAACQAEPILNAHFDGENLTLAIKKEINLGLAIDTPNGLYVPILKDIAQKTPQEIRQNIQIYKEKAQNNTFSPHELQDNTLTLSNFGTITGRYANPIVVPPTVAIIGVGKMRDQLVAWDKKSVIHPILPISFTFDHRAVTGGEAMRFLATLIKQLEAQPSV